MIPVKIDGIPCYVEINYHEGCKGSYTGGLQNEPDEPATWEIKTVCDRKYYLAPWLERKLDNDNVMQNLEEQVNSYIEHNK